MFSGLKPEKQPKIAQKSLKNYSMILVTFEPIYPGFSGYRPLIIKNNLRWRPVQQFFSRNMAKIWNLLPKMTKKCQKVPKKP